MNTALASIELQARVDGSWFSFGSVPWTWASGNGLQKRPSVPSWISKIDSLQRSENSVKALVAAGYASLDAQARLLGLSRSTTWTILRGSHKSSGLSARIVHRMLSAPKLPVGVRAEIFEYVEAKAAGLYGHSRTQRERFVGRLAGEKPACVKAREMWRNLQTRVWQGGYQGRSQPTPPH